MKKSRFLLFDTGPIIKLFELGLWDDFIGKCDVTLCRTVACEAKWASQEDQDTCIDLETYERANRIRILDVELSVIKAFYEKFDLSYKAELHPGEKETLAFLDSSSEEWLVCAADGAVFRVLGLLGKGEQEYLWRRCWPRSDLGANLNPHFTEQFRQRHTAAGRIDFAQDKGLR